ncbi:MAG TPA: thymidine phosphorylase [Phototrophicaceae bacterium]|nr:thymidine phosphorylase [Phototrophicaceae bacterium]
MGNLTVLTKDDKAMRAVDVIAKKRDGQILAREEIEWFVQGYTRDEIPDYQAAAFLMAVYFRGMVKEETVSLTLAMAKSGDTLDLSDIVDYAVDKHSSGGVGDKTSLVVLPLVASCGVTVAKMSGRGLGLSGGTLDKLESISGFNFNLTEDQFRANAREHGLVLGGQSKDLAPADGKFYALRDVTATVPSLPLIVSSIMSKKIAAGANGIVLDVKAGSGAFMGSVDEARELARLMVEIGVSSGRDMIAVVSDMNQPLGQAVGNALEVAEALEILNNTGDHDLREHCLQIAGHMLRLAGRGTRWTDAAEVRQLLENQLATGAALVKFREMVIAQGGDVHMIDDPSLLPKAQIIETWKAEASGYLSRVDAEKIARIAFELGAGREKKTDQIDFAVGVRVHVKVGDKIEAGQPLLTVYANNADRLESSKVYFTEAFMYSSTPVEPLPLFYDTFYGDQI